MGDNFVKRLAPALISVALVSGCGSQGPASGVPATVQQVRNSSASTSAPLIYVANPDPHNHGRASILGFAADASGNVKPTVSIRGPRTGLNYYAANVAVDKLGRVYTTGSDHNLGVVYIWPTGGNRDTKPIASLHVGGDITPYPMVLTFDQLGDLWVGSSNEGGGFIAEYPPLPANVTGSLARRFRSLRMIAGSPPPNEIGDFLAIAVKSSGEVSVRMGSTIVTYPRTPNKSDAPISEIAGERTQLDGGQGWYTSYDTFGGMHYDSQGRLIVCTTQSQPRLLTFAPNAHGNVAPISTLTVAGCAGITLDPDDNVYVAFGGSISEYSAGANGSAPPIRVISGSLTTLSKASGIAF